MNEENITVVSTAESQTKPANPKRTDEEKLRDCYEKREKLQILIRYRKILKC